MGERRVSYLLDTHTIVWALTEPDRLGPSAREAILDRGNTLLASAASAWEIATKYRLGKLPNAEGFIEGYSAFLDRLGLVRLPILEEHSLLAGRLQWSHRDPFDRMLAAQATLEPVPFLTKDSAFSALPNLRVIW